MSLSWPDVNATATATWTATVNDSRRTKKLTYAEMQHPIRVRVAVLISCDMGTQLESDSQI